MLPAVIRIPPHHLQPTHSAPFSLPLPLSDLPGVILKVTTREAGEMCPCDRYSQLPFHFLGTSMCFKTYRHNLCNVRSLILGLNPLLG